MLWLSAVVMGRLVTESGTPPPDVIDEAVLFVKRHNVVVGPGCPGGDAGVDGGLGDGGVPPDALTDGGVADASDGGMSDGGVGDGGVPGGGECTSIPGDAITMIVRPRVTTTVDGSRFAVLYVTPARPVVETTSDVFTQLGYITEPIIEHKTVEVEDPALGKQCEPCGCGGGGDYGGGGCEGGYGGGDYWNPPGLGDAGYGDGGLVVETTGPYQFVRAQPADAAQLASWLDQLGYAYTQDDLDAVAPYIALGYHVVAVRVAITSSSDANLVPISITWPGSEIRIPAALNRATGIGPWPLTVYIAAETRYEFAGASVPYAMRTSGADMAFVTKNQIRVYLDKPPSADPIAAQASYVEYHETKVETEYVHVPVSVQCDCDDGGCCRNCNTRSKARMDWVVLATCVAFVLRRRRRPRPPTARMD